MGIRAQGLLIWLAVVGAQTAQAGQSPAAPSPVPAQPSVQAPVQLTPEQEGDTLMAQRRYQAAIVAYQRQSRPDAQLLNKQGIAYQMLFNLNDAQRCYQASLKLDGKNPHVLNNLGTVFDSMRNYGAAERLYRRALKIEPASALVLKNLGTNLLAQRKTKKGYEAYQQALKADPNIFTDSTSPHVENPASVEARGAMNYYMARSCARAGQFYEAIQHLRLSLLEGYTTPKKIVADLEFAPLRGIPEFEQLLNPEEPGKTVKP
jgi:tetratricopeptide (TPR) repeat protein